VDEVLYQNHYFSVHQRDGYVFIHEVRCNGVIVALLPFRTSPNTKIEYLARLEHCPAHGPEMERCSITGGLEPGKSVQETACLELWQEAGYQVDPEELISLGEARPTKSADTVVHLFAVDVTHKAQSPPPGDGSRYEAMASVEWVDYQEGLRINDPLFVTALARLQALKSKGE
jgi:8-oxo-dGTP pyrophosphatase MutT (NUDIX family)